MKARIIEEAKKFTDIPNVGPRIAEDLILLGFKNPQKLKGKDAFEMYKRLEELTNSYQDPCVLDTFMAVVDFANGSPARKWFRYTLQRKLKYKI